MKYIEILNRNTDCNECFLENEIVDISSLSREEDYFTHRWHPSLASIPEDRLTVAEAYQVKIDFEQHPGFAMQERTLRAHLKAATTAKIPSGTCVTKIIPNRIYTDFCLVKSDVIRDFLLACDRPDNYDHFLGIKKIIDSIATRKILLDPSRIRSSKQVKIIRTKNDKVIYDATATATGRLSTKKGSFPIMTLSTEDRSFIVPTNDLLVEFDFNAAEVRTLLSLSGSQQPSNDIHEWNSTLVGDTGDHRKRTKEKFFGWLYNQKRKEESWDQVYNKQVYKKYYNSEMSTISTPFGRKLKVEESKALNYLIQSTSSDMMLEQAKKVMDRLQELKCKTFIKFLMHDSIVLDLDKSDLPLMSSLLEEFSTTRFGNYLVNVRYGKDFYNLRTLKWKT